jgi:fermentation-respiration switch protein FrsA (DUF1100 family)
MFSLQRSLLFPRFMMPPPEPNAGAGIPGLERLKLELDDGYVEAWLLPGDGATADKPGPAVIFGHGNGELIDFWPELLHPYQRLGLTLLLPEFRGYGRSGGSPSEEAIAQDFVRFHDLLAARPEVDPNRIVFHGRSMGGGAVCALARQRKPAAMILMSTFTSIRRMARRYLMPGFLVRDPLDNLEVVRGLDRPLLILHGRRDGLVPYEHAEQLHRASPGSRLISYPQADHNDCPPDWGAFWREAEAFMKEAGILDRGPQ